MHLIDCMYISVCVQSRLLGGRAALYTPHSVAGGTSPNTDMAVRHCSHQPFLAAKARGQALKRGHYQR
jgi:hypothetical protein